LEHQLELDAQGGKRALSHTSRHQARWTLPRGTRRRCPARCRPSPKPARTEARN